MIYVWRINHSDFTFYSCYVIAYFLVKNKQTNSRIKECLKGVTRVEVDCVKVNSQCTECNIEVIADRNLQIPGPECE